MLSLRNVVVTGAIATGVRAAVATLVPFLLASQLGRPELAWMALGGWLGTLVDPGGAKSTRALAVGSFALIGGLLVPLAERCSVSPWMAALFLGATAFAGTLARVLGSAAATVGTMTAIVVAVATARSGRGVSDAFYFVAGASWAAILSSIVWPIGTHVPAREAVARVYAELAAYARGIDAAADAPAGARWSELALAHHGRVRAAIEEALAVALAVRARRPGESALGSDLRVLLGLAEAQFPQLIALAEELESTAVSDRPREVRARLGAVASAYEAVARRVVIRWPGRAAPASPAVAAAPSDPAAPSSASSLAEILARRLDEESENARALVGVLGSGVAVPSPTDSSGPSRERAEDVARELRDALSFRSVFFRHALRVAAAVTVASLVGHRVALQPHWVTITTLAVLQPYAGPTWTRASERVVGTVLGSSVAVVITMTIHSPLVLGALMFPLSVAAVATRPRSHRLFAFFLTPVFVLIAESHPGDWWTAVARATDSMVGGAIALLAALVFFPSWERTRLPDALDTMIAAVTTYRDLVLDRIDRARTPSVEEAIAQARRAVGIAIGEAETSLERALAEPVLRTRETERAMQLITHARRLTNACTALDARAAHGLLTAPASRSAHMRTIATYSDAIAAR